MTVALLSIDRSYLTGVIAKENRPLDQSDPKNSVMRFVRQACNNLLKKAPTLDAIGIASAGVIHEAVTAPIVIARLGWDKGEGSTFCAKDILDVIADFWTVPKSISVANDTTAFAVAEWGARSVGKSEGARHQKDVLAYIHFGAGVNAGVVYSGRPFTGGINPELGHALAPTPQGFSAECYCKRHKDSLPGLGCVEGMVGKAALEKRFGYMSYDDLWRKTDGKALAFSAHYLAFLCTLITLTFSPDRIVIGPNSGSSVTPELLAAVRTQFVKMIGNYPLTFRQAGEAEVTSKEEDATKISIELDEYIEKSLVPRAGRISGAAIIAFQELDRH